MSPVQPHDSALEPCDAPPIDAAFIILLDRDEKRRENAHATLSRVGHDVEIFHAVKGSSLTSADVERLIHQGYVGADCAKRLTREACLCAQSHPRSGRSGNEAVPERAGARGRSRLGGGLLGEATTLCERFLESLT